MFIKTQGQRLINSDKVYYFELMPSLNTDQAYIEAYMPGNKTFVIFSGTVTEAQRVFCAIADKLSAKDTAVFDLTATK